MMLQHRHQPRLQGVADVVGLDDGVGFGVELLLEVVQHRAGPTAAPRRVFAQPMQLLRRIAQPAAGVGDLRVRRQHQPVGAAQREDDRHVSDRLTADKRLEPAERACTVIAHPLGTKDAGR